LLAIGAGLLAGAQVGEAHIALPSIRQSFSLSLVSASWILSAISFMGLVFATLSGTWSAMKGKRRSLAGGLFIIAAASAAGAAAPSAFWLVISRVIEGLGVVVVVVSAPSLIVDLSAPKDVKLALAGWATFMPGGIALVTVLAPLLLAFHTWRALWMADALVVGGFAFIVMFLVRDGAKPDALRRPLLEMKGVLTAQGPVLLAIIFAMYTLQHIGIMGFLPTILIDDYGLAAQRAGLLASIVMASNIIGNLTAGVLLQRGVRRSVLIVDTSLFMVLMTFGLFSAHLPLTGAYACAVLFSCIGGIIPATLLSAAPFYSPSDQLIPATNGLLVQGSNLGIVLGPPLIGAIATHAGWFMVPIVAVCAALVAIGLSFVLKQSPVSRQADWLVEDTGLSHR
jgi:predicted MFS family arabinose efflux permease